MGHVSRLLLRQGNLAGRFALTKGTCRALPGQSDRIEAVPEQNGLPRLR
jgi:hypothetical protein